LLQLQINQALVISPFSKGRSWKRGNLIFRINYLASILSSIEERRPTISFVMGEASLIDKSQLSR